MIPEVQGRDAWQEEKSPFQLCFCVFFQQHHFGGECEDTTNDE